MLMPPPRRITVLALAALVLVACADQPNHRSPPTVTKNVTAPRTSVSAAATTRSTTPSNDTSSTTVTLPDKTGIAACDNYLSTYIACHRAAGIYPSNQLQSRYEEMRHSLIEDSQSPDMRSQLAARCTALSQGLHQALHGKACDSDAVPTAPASGLH